LLVDCRNPRPVCNAVMEMVNVGLSQIAELAALTIVTITGKYLSDVWQIRAI
jgi:hypothetical protein